LPAIKSVVVFIWLGWALLAGLAHAQPVQPVQPVPPLTAHVLDATATLDDSQKAALEARLAALEAAKGSQVVVLMLSSTAPEDIASYANRVGNTWKIGRKGVGDGVLVVVAKDDRKMRIEVAKTLEGAIPDLAAKQIIDEALTPRFKAGDYAGGLDAGVTQLAARIQGEPLPPMKPVRTAAGHRGFQVEHLVLILFLVVPLLGAVLRNTLGRKMSAFLMGAGVGAVALWLTASLTLAALAALVALLFSLFGNTSSFSGGRGWSSGGGWSGGSGRSGGGFSSGGGGDFGGGGASGDW
jgi:uncharacterized protein